MYFCGTFRLSSDEITPREGAGSTCGDAETPGAEDAAGAGGRGAEASEGMGCGCVAEGIRGILGEEETGERAGWWVGRVGLQSADRSDWLRRFLMAEISSFSWCISIRCAMLGRLKSSLGRLEARCDSMRSPKRAAVTRIGESSVVTFRGKLSLEVDTSETERLGCSLGSVSGEKGASRGSWYWWFSWEKR